MPVDRRAMRRASTERIVKRRSRFQHGGVPTGRARKTHPLDCGHARCFCCHSEKILNRPPMRDLRRMEALCP